MQTQSLHLANGPYVVIPKAEYERLVTRSKAADLPPLPPPDAQGNVPAVATGRASVAREIITRRSALGWNQKELAAAAGVRVETVCRLETAKHTASVPTVEKLDKALAAAEKKLAKKNGLTGKRSGR